MKKNFFTTLPKGCISSKQVGGATDATHPCGPCQNFLHTERLGSQALSLHKDAVQLAKAREEGVPCMWPHQSPKGLEDPSLLSCRQELCGEGRDRELWVPALLTRQDQNLLRPSESAKGLHEEMALALSHSRPLQARQICMPNQQHPQCREGLAPASTGTCGLICNSSGPVNHSL